MNITEILEKFNAKLSENSWWARFVNSQFVQMMTVLGGQIIYTSQTHASRALTEGFISTATRRASILAAAEDRGYVGRFVLPSAGSVSIKNNLDTVIKLPAGAELLTKDQTPIVIVGSIEITPKSTVSGVAVKQYEEVNVTFNVESETPFMTCLLPRDLTAETASLVVTVSAAGKDTIWKNNPLFRMSRADSQHYAMVYKPTEQLGVRFGDGSMGMMPPAGATVTLGIHASKGDYTLATGQVLEAAGNIARYRDALSIVTDSIITGGGGMENTEVTRNRAQYYVPFDEQVIWGGDYRHFIETQVRGISWLNVWGEAIEEQVSGFNVRNINRIFFCGSKPGISQAALCDEIMQALNSVPNELNKHFEYVPTNEMPFTIMFSGVVKKSVLVEDAKSALTEALESGFGRESDSFSKLLQSDDDTQFARAQVKVKDIWSLIESLELFLSYDLAAVDMSDAVKMNDFVFLDVAASVLKIDYPEGKCNETRLA